MSEDVVLPAAEDAGGRFLLLEKKREELAVEFEKKKVEFLSVK